MNKLKSRLALIGILYLCGSPLLAQSVKLTSGSPKVLKGETVLNLEYVYDGLTVGKKPEQKYIDEKVGEMNTKEAGKGDHWLESWKGDRERRYQPKFEELLNKQFSEKKVGLEAGKHPEAKYTLVLKTTMLDPGFNVGVFRQPAAVSTEAAIYETMDRTKQVAVITILKAPGQDAMGYDFDTGQRLAEGFAKTGKELGKFLCKSLK